MEPVTRLDLIRWSEALSGIARTGLGFTESLYEQERFEEVLRLAADMRAAADRSDEGEAVESSLVYDTWRGSVGQGVAGYVTPRTTVGAVVGDPDGRLLLVQRRDSGFWLYPTGWADVGYSPAEVAIKEVAEETGIEVEVVGLLGVVDSFRFGISRFPFYMNLFLCRPIGGSLKGHPLETSDVGWFSRDELPSPLAIRPDWVDLVFRALAGEAFEPFFDPPRKAP